MVAAALALPGCPTDNKPAAVEPAAVPPQPATTTPTRQDGEGPKRPTADVPGPSSFSEREKIDWLIAQVGASEVVFIRNGVEATPEAAAAHLRGKLKAAGDRVSTAREFIDHLASKSSATGRPYQIRTSDGRTVESRQWFIEKLEALEGMPGPEVPEPAASASTPEDVLAVISGSDAAFRVIEDDETEERPGPAMASRIRFKYALAGSPGMNAQEFIERFCTTSSVHGTEYEVRLSDGSTVKLAAWLRSQIAASQAPGGSR